MVERRENKVGDTVDLLGSLSITQGSRKIDTNKMEWKLGGAKLMNQYASSKNLDSDDDSEDNIDIDDFVQNDPDFQKNPLKILASRLEVACYRKQQKSPINTSEKTDNSTTCSQSSLGKNQHTY